MRSFTIAACFIVGLGAAGVALANTVGRNPIEPSATYSSKAVLDGFRTATYGMTLAEVKRAAVADLHVPSDSLHVVTDPQTLTTDVIAVVPKLVPQLGKGEVTYVLGYSSKKLDAVVVSWSPALDKANTPKAMIDAGRVLQTYFSREGFAPGHAYADRLLKGGNFVLFHGDDEQGRSVTVALEGRISKLPADAKDAGNAGDSKDSKAAKPKAIFTPQQLVIAYIEHPGKPDVYHLPKGAF